MHLLLAAALVAAKPPADDKVSPGLLGFLVTFALVLATVLLMRSMVGHLRKVRYSPGPDGGPDAGPAAEPPAGDGKPPGSDQGS